MNLTELIKKEVIKIDKKAQVILFGSRARGDHSEQSDWDFLILLEQEATEKKKREIRDKIFEIELKTNEIISSIIEQKNEWSKFQVTPLFKNIKREGLSI